MAAASEERGGPELEARHSSEHLTIRLPI